MSRKKVELPVAPPVDLSGVTIQQLEQKIQLLADEERYADEAKAELAKRVEVVENTKSWLCAFMREHNKSSYPSTWGTLVRRIRQTYGVPKTNEDRDLFFGYLKAKGIFENLITVHSATLNSYVSGEQDAAAERGEFDFTVPGLGQPTVFESVSLTRKGAK